ncbi:hypothetical protein AB0M46_33705 [Dactylosporangium sp. NPDC051485]|uniref:hypothetical protein n=1 Tax=Dactylosporangium sp. NPDC051485 TaxID=3154846 RepID=UPI003446C5B5
MTRSIPATPLTGRRTVLRAALLASAALGVGLLSACGSGQITQTDAQVPAVPGINANSKDGLIALRDGVVVYADQYKPGSTVPINVRLFNNSTQAVKLTGVTSDNGTFVLVGGTKAAAAAASPSPSSTHAGASPTLSGTKKPSAGASSSESAVAESEAPSAAPAPTSAGSSEISVPIPVAGIVVLSHNSGTYLAVDKLSGAPLLSGGSLKNVKFTFTYADGKTTTIELQNLPMTTPLTPLPKPSPVVKHENGGE